MEESSTPRSSRLCNVLALDGGGVRGLSSLLILKALMSHINQAIVGLNAKTPTVGPQDIFDLVAGTSTGGLIAIMLGKLRMDVEQCIRAYKELSKAVFGKRHKRSWITQGLAPTRYCGKRMEKCVRRLLRDRGLDEALQMASSLDDTSVASAVICREHEFSRYSDLKDGAVLICSLQCPEQVQCKVSEAARATSAAPTYFSAQKIGDRYFVDGGMEYNNPSHAIYRHYCVRDTHNASRGNRARNVVGAKHAHLDLSQIRIINLGTGDTVDPGLTLTHKKDPGTQVLVPDAIRMGKFLKRELTKIAVSSQKVVEIMDVLADSSAAVRYKRFSADTGVCYIKLNRYKKLKEIEDLTNDYIQSGEIQERLRDLGLEIAKDYVRERSGDMASGTVSPTGVVRDEPDSAILLDPSPQGNSHLRPDTRGEASTNASSENGNGAISDTTDPSTEGAEYNISSSLPDQDKTRDIGKPIDPNGVQPQVLTRAISGVKP